MSKWDGRYSGTNESKQSLEQDIIDAMGGKICGELEGGGTFRQTDDQIDVYAPSGSDRGHSHDWVNRDGSHGHHD